MTTEHLALGLMSGTSGDGLDLALCRFLEDDQGWRYEVVTAESRPYTESWHKALTEAHHLDAASLIALDRNYGTWLGKQASDFLLNGPRPMVVSSHGHTVFHAPKQGYTLQIGHGAYVAAACGLPVVCDLRSSDVAYNGEGAPLVPLGDALLFNQFDLCLNLGGFANLSYATPTGRLAFDVCPMNLPINTQTQKLGLAFDHNGAIAAAQQPNAALLDQLLALYSTTRPSLSREWLETNFNPILDYCGLSTETIIATLTEHSAIELARVLNTLPGQTVLLTGGGAHNQHFVARLRTVCTKTIHVPNAIIIDFKEAIVWAFLGLLRWLGRENVWSSYTGAQKNVVAGALYLP